MLRPSTWLQWLTLALALTIGITMPILFTRLQDVTKHQNDSLRSIICRIEYKTIIDTQLTPQEKTKDIKFYNGLLESIHVSTCGPLSPKTP